MPLPIYVVDAFTDRPFAGNPAAVCLLDRERGAAWMQALAAEMNLSETAFLQARGEAWSLRWFTPRAEVALCGHATLAAAHVIWESARQAVEAPVLFDTLSGRLTARRAAGDAGGGNAWIELDFPAMCIRDRRALARAGLRRAGQASGARRHRHRRQRRRLRPRFRFTLLRARSRRSRGPGHRVGALLSRSVLGGKAR